MRSRPRQGTVETLICRKSWKVCSAARTEATVRHLFRQHSYALRSPVEQTAHRSTAVLLASFLTQACGAGWHQSAQLSPGPLPVRQQVQVWQRGRALQWHAVSVSSDSVTGIPFHRPVDCGTCRLTVPRSGIDSLRLGNPTAGFWKTIGLVVGIPVLAFVVMCSSGEGGPPCSSD